MKNYFPHDHYARSDKKLVNLLRKQGMAGLGLYWCLVEMLYEENGWLKTADLESIAYDLRVSIDQITAIIKDFDLFFISGPRFSSHSVLARLKIIEVKSSKAAKAAKTRWQKCKDDANALKLDANALQTHTPSNALKEIKVKEIKVNQTKEDEVLPASPSTPTENKISELFPDALKAKPENPKEKSCAKKEKVIEHLFRDSPFFDFSKFLAQFPEPRYGEVNLEHYYHAAADWSAENGKKKVDWIAAVRRWIREDANKGQLKTKYLPTYGQPTYSGRQQQRPFDDFDPSEVARALAS